jgi:hypothetical protein
MCFASATRKCRMKRRSKACLHIWNRFQPFARAPASARSWRPRGTQRCAYFLPCWRFPRLLRRQMPSPRPLPSRKTAFASARHRSIAATKRPTSRASRPGWKRVSRCLERRIQCHFRRHTARSRQNRVENPQTTALYRSPPGLQSPPWRHFSYGCILPAVDNPARRTEGLHVNWATGRDDHPIFLCG